MSEGARRRIFISYRNEDWDRFVEHLGVALQGFGYIVLTDRAALREVSTEWRSHVLPLIESSDLFIAVTGATYWDSNECKEELNFARDRTKPLVGLTWDEADARHLADWPAAKQLLMRAEVGRDVNVLVPAVQAALKLAP